LPRFFEEVLIYSVPLLDLVQRRFQQVAPVANHPANESRARHQSAPTLVLLRRCGIRLRLLTLSFSFAAGCLLSL
jgi:hypothetical protein